MTPSNRENGQEQLDPLIHEASRLTIMAVLNECEAADFNFLLGTSALTRGNLSAHMAKLVNADYVDEKKEFRNRKPHTEYRMTPAGRTAYRRYRKAWRNLTSNGSKSKAQR